jgi:hypothetical protein
VRDGKTKLLGEGRVAKPPAFSLYADEFFFFRKKVSPAFQENVYYIKGGVKPFSA